MITAGATPTPKTIDQRRVALTSPQVKTLQTDNAGTLKRELDQPAAIPAYCAVFECCDMPNTLSQSL